MFSISDGKEKLLYNYKALESLKLKPLKMTPSNFLELNNNRAHSKSKFFSFQNGHYENNEENPSKFIKAKNKEISKINKQLFNKKVDILINKVFDRSENIRHYNSYRDSIHLNNMKFPILNNKSQSMNKYKLFKIKIKNLISTNFEHIFPEKYINSRERVITNENNKHNLYLSKYNFKPKAKKFKIKYLTKINSQENKKGFNMSKKEKLINKIMTIYSGKYQNKLLSNIKKENSYKKIDVGLNNNNIFLN